MSLNFLSNTMKTKAPKKEDTWFNRPAAKKKPQKKKQTWANSESKAMVHCSILSGDVKDEMTEQQVYDLAPEVHAAWIKKSSRTN